MCDRPGAHTQLATRERNERVREAIDRLPPKYRAIVCLYYLDEMPVAEIAEAMEMPGGTVKIRLHRARALLRERLQDTLGQGREAALRLGNHEGSGGGKAMRAASS
jgi:DNA-directed RNA polymerase specialized sigma24 family protein